MCSNASWAVVFCAFRIFCVFVACSVLVAGLHCHSKRRKTVFSCSRRVFACSSSGCSCSFFVAFRCSPCLTCHVCFHSPRLPAEKRLEQADMGSGLLPPNPTLAKFCPVGPPPPSLSCKPMPWGVPPAGGSGALQKAQISGPPSTPPYNPSWNPLLFF